MGLWPSRDLESKNGQELLYIYRGTGRQFAAPQTEVAGARGSCLSCHWSCFLFPLRCPRIQLHENGLQGLRLRQTPNRKYHPQDSEEKPGSCRSKTWRKAEQH